MDRILTISQLNDYITGTMAHDPILRNLSLRGEISNMRITSSGHAYFALKDEEALIACVCFASALAPLSFSPMDGDHVTAHGYISVYARSGQMQFYTQNMEREGQGQLFERFERTKAELAAKGYFAEDRKRTIPAFPRCIGIVTSPTGAVLRDIQNVSWRRNPSQHLLLCPAKVQGDKAAAEIARGIAMLNTIESVDVIIIARGGGSLEDLWAFNEIPVAEAIYASEKPVVSAVGHETDFSIADMVADLRAPTPSAAAELVTPRVDSALLEWERLRDRLNRSMARSLEDRHMALALLARSDGMARPKRQLENGWQRLDSAEEKVRAKIEMGIRERNAVLTTLALRLELSGPNSLLERGYALVQKEDGQVVRSGANLRRGEKILLRFARGKAHAEILDVEG